jgi:hypothetical protein
VDKPRLLEDGQAIEQLLRENLDELERQSKTRQRWFLCMKLSSMRRMCRVSSGSY